MSSVQKCLTGGSSLARCYQESMSEKLKNGQVTIIYGMSEAGGGICRLENLKKAGSVGCIAYDTEIKIIDENGRSLGIQESGEICYKSKYSFMVIF